MGKNKPFGQTKFGSFLKKAGAVALDKGGDILEITAMAATNPIGAVLKAKDMLLDSDSPGTDDLAAELEKNQANYMKELEMNYADRKDARDMYRGTDHEMADSIAGKIINWNLWILLALVAIQVLVIMFVEGQVAAVVTGVVGTITGALINERNTVVNFFFGSSKGSKDKDR